jgi:hypothetical protein
MKNRHIERICDETFGLMVTIRSQPLRLSLHESQHEPRRWRPKQSGAYERAELEDEFLYEFGLALDTLLTWSRSVELDAPV